MLKEWKDWIAKKLGLPHFVWLQVLLTLVLLALGAFFVGIFRGIGTQLVENPPETQFFSSIWNFLVLAITINPLVILIILIAFIPSYHFLNKWWINKQNSLVFKDLFDKQNLIWHLNYWGENGLTITKEHAHLIFATNSQQLGKGENGAFCDLHSGIYEGQTYKIECKVRSDGHCTMGFRLWVHGTDVLPGPGVTIPEPPNFHLPPSHLETYSLRFIATASNAMRIHLHCLTGSGRILVKEVKVTRL